MIEDTNKPETPTTEYDPSMEKDVIVEHWAEMDWVETEREARARPLPPGAPSSNWDTDTDPSTCLDEQDKQRLRALQKMLRELYEPR